MPKFSSRDPDDKINGAAPCERRAEWWNGDAEYGHECMRTSAFAFDLHSYRELDSLWHSVYGCQEVLESVFGYIPA